MGTSNSVIQPMQKVQNAAAHFILRAPRHQHCTPLLQNFIGFQFLNASNTKLPVCVTTQSLVPPPLTFLNYCSCAALSALSALQRTHAYSNSQASTAKQMAFALSPISVLISGTTSPKVSDTLILSRPSKTNSRHFSSLSISTECYCP